MLPWLLCYPLSCPGRQRPERGPSVRARTPGSCGTAAQRLQGAGEDYYCFDWFLCFKQTPLEQMKLPPEAKVGEK